MPIFRLADHRRALATLIAASFVAATVTVGGPATAQTDEPSPSTGSARSASERPAPDSSTPGLAPAAAGLLTGRLLYTTASNLTPRPMNSGVVTAYRWTGSRFEEQGETVIFDADGDWSISGLPAGDYTVSYRQTGEVPNSRGWYENSRSLRKADTFSLFDGAPLNLGSRTLPPRVMPVFRKSGGDRFATGVALTEREFTDNSEVNVVIVNGLDYPDALSAGPLANAIDGAMLMVTPTSIPPVVAAELLRLDPLSITIVGGTGVVSEAVQTQLGAYVSNPVTQVRRIAGADRYATSRAVLNVGFAGLDPQTVLLATGRNFPDALAAGPAAGYTDGAVLLLDGSALSLDGPTRTILQSLNVQNYIIGGTGTISAGIEQSAVDLGLDVRRIAGLDRFETSIQVAVEIFNFADEAYIVNGFGFADALSAGPIAGGRNAPIYLTTASCINNAVFNDIIELLANGLVVVGGTGVLSPAVQNFQSCDGRFGPVPAL